jgi:D-alanyl-lipoteichoic acid acyltransferase DltB (MBOAT superfamily)
MLFNSLTFLVFFASVFALHALMPTWGARKAVLLVASYLFYAAWNPPYVLILAFSTTADWWLARLIGRSEDPARRRALLILSLACNLSLLGFFKYGGFLLENFQGLAGAAGLAWQPPEWSIVLPVGISFYTFASLSYTIDVYRRQVRSDCSLADYALFVSFFPHLVAGPIVRASLLLPQLEQPRRASPDQVGWGLCLLCFGLFQKAVLADAVFAPIVDAVYAEPAAYGTIDALAAVLAFSGQIYYDFAGYSLAAIGLALTFGFEFPDNFRQPYAASGFSDFWRRWHISLSTWLRDYLYIPLGGNREGEWRAGRNLMLTMLIGGLWHGASWMFVLWGALHGLYLAIEREWRRRRPARDGAASVIGILATFAVVSLTWIPFRAPEPATALAVLESLGRTGAPSLLDAAHLAFAYGAIGLTLLWQLRTRASSLEARFAAWTPAARTAALAMSAAGIFLASGGDQRAFIYFQF